MGHLGRAGVVVPVEAAGCFDSERVHITRSGTYPSRKSRLTVPEKMCRAMCITITYGIIERKFNIQYHTTTHAYEENIVTQPGIITSIQYHFLFLPVSFNPSMMLVSCPARTLVFCLPECPAGSLSYHSSCLLTVS